MSSIKKTRYVCIFADGGVSISTDKLTTDEAEELFDINSDYDVQAILAEQDALKVAQSIINLVTRKPTKKIKQ